MVTLRTAIVSVSSVILDIDSISFGRGMGLLNTSDDVSVTVPGYANPFRATPFRVPDNTTQTYSTVFQDNYRLEDVGFLEVQDIVVTLNQDVLGNGQLRWQISGNGGTTFTTIFETAVFNVTAWTAQNAQGGGIWVSQINVGDNKLQLIMQTKAVAGTVKARIFDSSTLTVKYRKKVLT